MRTKNLFYLLLALPLVLGACNKKSGDDGKVPTSSYDVTLEAQYLLMAYFGDKFSPGVDNYSIIIAENKFLMELAGGSLTEGSYYCLDLYAPITEEGNLPVGTYTLDMGTSCAEWTIDDTTSRLIEVGADGGFIPDDEGIAFSDATLVIKEGYAELTAVIDGKSHFVTFSGKFARIDSTSNEGYILHETTLVKDVEVESEEAMFIVEVDNGVAKVFAMEGYDANGAMFMLEVVLAEGSDSISGTYSVADGTLNVGTYNSEELLGSWYFDVVDGEWGSEYAAIQGGSVTFVQEGEECHMTLDCVDAEGYAIKATMSGMFGI